MRRRLFTTHVLALLILLVVPAVVQAMTYDQAVSQLVKDGWPQAIEQKLMTFHSSSLGFRSAGTPADDAQARYIARVMQRIGLTSVHLEGVPVDEWNFKGASVRVTGAGYSNPVTYTASSFGGVVGTASAGVTDPVVYVHGGSAAEFDAAGDVTGKIVLVDFESPMWWMSYPAMEAGLRGAKAVILTHSDEDAMAGYYDIPTALGCFDAETQLSAPPMVYVSWNSGIDLKKALDAGPVTATVRNNATIRLADDGGKGYNVLGQIRGTRDPGQMVVYGSHHDAWFNGALDNASAVVNELLTAKAMKMSGYQPKRTVLFFSTTGEEYGYTQSYYDWCIGAWHAITQRHPEWAGRITAYLNSELLGYRKGNLWMLASPEITPTLNNTLAASGDLMLTTKNAPAPAVIGGPWCWNDQWTFTAAGVPSVCFWSQDKDYSGYIKTHVYHTQYDTPNRISWRFLGDINKFEYRVARKYAGNTALLPYDFTARSDDLAAALSADVNTDALGAYSYDDAIKAHVGAPAYADFTAAVKGFDTAAADYAANADAIPASDYPSVNARLLTINRLINANFTGMNWLDNTVYPFQQTTFDIAMMDQAAHIIDAGDTGWQDAASSDVSQVGLMWYGINFSHGVFAKELQRHRQSYYRICWGGQGHLDKYQDLMPEYDAIRSGDDSTAYDGLVTKMGAQVTDLSTRVADMTLVLDEASSQIEDLLPPVETR